MTRSELVQFRGKSQITLPAFVRRALGLQEGDLFDVTVREGEIVLRPKRVIDHSQTWFWTDRWQAGEREAEESIATGTTQQFESADSAIRYLRSRSRTVRTEETS